MQDDKPEELTRAGRERRDFVEKSSVLASGIALAGAAPGLVHAAGPDRIKLAVIGCGGRGTGAMAQAMRADQGVELVAVADAFPEKARRCAMVASNKKRNGCYDHEFVISEVNANYNFWTKSSESDALFTLLGSFSTDVCSLFLSFLSFPFGYFITRTSSIQAGACARSTAEREGGAPLLQEVFRRESERRDRLR